MNALRRGAGRAFTLIEMLVVIGIIAVLAALLLPVLGRAREQGRRTACLGNLSQIGMALSLYADTCNDYLPSYPGWGLNPCAVSYDSMSLTTYADHQGPSRHMVLGYGGEESDPAETLTPGRLNFVPVGLGILLARRDITERILLCPSMQGTVPTWYNSAQYEYASAMSSWLGQGGDKALVTGDGREFYHTDTGNGTKVTAVLSSYSYRDTPFYSRLRPDNVPAGWTYTSDYPSLSQETPGGQWLAEWVLESTRPKVRAQFMTPPFKTRRTLGGRAIVADSFDNAPLSEGYFTGGAVMYHHREGYNVLYGDSHVAWFQDEEDQVAKWNDWADPANPGTDNLTISSHSGQKVWNLFDQSAGVDVPP